MVALTDHNLMTFAEYLDWEPTQTDRYEFWDGEVVAMSGTTRNHNRIAINFLKILDDALAGGTHPERNHPCEVYISDVKVQVQPQQKYFYPDIVVTCDERDRTETQLVLYPYLIIEVLSPSTELYDRGLKFANYRRAESLQEYVLVQVDQPMVEVFRRSKSHPDGQDQWVFSEYELGDRLFLTSINIEITVSDLYRQIQFTESPTAIA